MEKKVRKTIFGAIGATGLLLSFGVYADTYPSQPIRLIVPFDAGSATDVLARVVGQAMSNDLGQPVIVENVGGAGSTIGVKRVIASKADGYTVLMSSNAGVVSSPAGLIPNAGYDPLTELEPVGKVAHVYYVLTTNKDFPASSTQQFIQAVKNKPGHYNYATANAGSQIYMAMLKQKYELDIEEIPYKSTPAALTDLLTGRVEAMFLDITSAKSRIEGGEIKTFAISSDKRSAIAPDIPTLSEVGVTGIPDMSGWWGMYVPKGTHGAAVDRLSNSLKKALHDADVVKRINGMGLDITWADSQQLAAFHASQMQSWKDAITTFNMAK